MDFERLKKSVEKIEMSDNMRARIISNCRAKKIHPKGGNRLLKVSAAAAVSLCLCFTATAVAASRFGFFKDATRWDGAIIGTMYERASDEVKVNVVTSGSEITVFAVMVNPNTAPFRELENLGIQSYQIIDLSGNIVVEDGHTDLFEVVNGETEVKIPLGNIPKGDYRLVIDAFVGGKKADQPLQINGTWECAFSV